MLVALLVGSALTGTLVGIYHAFDAVESTEPSQKARMLAAGISEAMNATPLALAAFLAPTIFALVLVVRGRKHERSGNTR